MRRLTDAELYEWTDPVTGKSYHCRRVFAKMIDFIEVGHENAILGYKLLERLGLPATDKNERDARKMYEIYRRMGKLVFSLASTKGGYYIAGPKDRKYVLQYVNLQIAHANSRIRNAKELLRKYDRKYPPQERFDFMGRKET